MNYHGAKWGDTTLGASGGRVTWSFDSSFASRFVGQNSVPTALLESSVRQAFGLWENLARIEFAELAKSSSASDISIGFGPIDGVSGTLGEASWYYRYENNGNKLIEGSIEFDQAEWWDFTQNPSASGSNFLAVALHEIGHAIGLGHSADPSSLMYPYLDDQRGPTLTDVAAIREIYGTNPSDTTPDIEIAGSGSQDVFRFYNTSTGTHFYTSSAAERDFVGATFPQYVYEGNAYDTTADEGATSVDVFRFYNTATKTHFYTASVAERDQVIATLATYQYEGEAYEASSTDGGGTREALYRFYNHATGVHFYTADELEVVSVFGKYPSFQYEGIAYYVDAA